MSDTTNSNSDEALLAQYPDLAEALAAKRAEIQRAFDQTADLNEYERQHLFSKHNGHPDVARYIKFRRTEIDALREKAEAMWQSAVDSEKGRAEREAWQRKMTEVRHQRDADLAGARTAIADSLRSFSDNCHKLVELLGKQGEPEEEIARIMGNTLGHRLNVGLLWTASRRFAN